MKILYIHNQYLYKGGEDTVFKAETDLVKQYGHEVKTLIFDNKNLNTLREKVLIGLMTIFNFSSAKVLHKMILEFQPDIIHVHNFFPIASPSIFFVAKKYGIPIIMTLHNYRLICPSATLYRKNTICEICIKKTFTYPAVIHGCYRKSKIQTLLLTSMSFFHTVFHTWHRNVTHYIALTDFEKNKYLQSSLKLHSSQITIKPNFVEDHDSLMQKENYFLYVGRLSEEKGIDILIETFKNSPYELRIIGNGPLVEQVWTTANIFTNIHYIGFQNKKFILESLKRAKALIFPSSCYETFGMSVIEAFSTGTPVICSDHGAPAELIQHMKNGLYFQSGNSIDLKQKVDWINTHPEQHYQLCFNARQEYEAKYTPKKNYTMLMKIYEEAIHAKTKNY